MAQDTIEAHRQGAEVYTDNQLCCQKMIELLEELNLPRGLLPTVNIEEMGINRRTGFIWIRQRKAFNYTYPKAGRLYCFGTEVTDFVENGRVRRVTGVKSKELLMWFSLGDFFVDPKDQSKITFRTPTGFSMSYPASAFELEKQGNRRLVA